MQKIINLLEKDSKLLYNDFVIKIIKDFTIMKHRSHELDILLEEKKIKHVELLGYIDKPLGIFERVLADGEEKIFLLQARKV